MKRGIIRRVVALGGLLQLVLEDPETGKRSVVFGDNGPTVRALACIFGDHIIQGHALMVDEVLGKEIDYSLTDWGTLESISEV